LIPSPSGLSTVSLVVAISLAFADVSALFASSPESGGVPAAQIEAVIDAMSPEEKVGQLLIAGLDHSQSDRNIQTLVREWGAGGVVLFRRDLGTPDEIRALTARLRGGRIAAFVATDLEGGFVRRVETLTPPSNMALGATGSADLAFRLGRDIGLELRALGFTMNLAPVLDVYRHPESSIGVRSYGSNADLVARLGSAFVRGQRDAGIIPVAKHFIGEGSAPGDSHKQSRRTTSTVSELEKHDLKPFRAAIDAGVPGVLVSHVSLPGITGDSTPATLSPLVVSGLLRERLRFRGIVIADALVMPATRGGDLAETAVQAFLAGADMLLAVGSSDERTHVRQGLLDAYRAGRISEDRIRASLRRILTVKSARPLAESEVLTSQFEATSSSIAESSITVVKACGDALPLLSQAESSNRLVAVTPAGARLPGLTSRQFTLDDAGSAKLARRLLQAVSRTDSIVLAFENARQAATAAGVARLFPKHNVIAVALGNPHDLRLVGRASGFITAYGSTPHIRTALVRALRDGRMTGALPIRHFNNELPCRDTQPNRTGGH
jgi:beta-N-acetylhexosaminidase